MMIRMFRKNFQTKDIVERIEIVRKDLNPL